MTVLYVNGDSHTAEVYGEGGQTATEQIAISLGLEYQNHALPGGSNQRIIRTTQSALKNLDPADTVIVIGWSSFERTEWFYKNQWHQICGDTQYQVDPELQTLWQQHIDSWWCDDNHECWRRQAEQHVDIYIFHQLLTNLGYQHLFYQGCRTFFFDGCPQQDQEFRLPWEDIWLHDPYIKLLPSGERIAESFSHYVESLGHQHVDDRAHYGQAAHDDWAQYIRPRIENAIRKLKKI